MGKDFDKVLTTLAKEYDSEHIMALYEYTIESLMDFANRGLNTPSKLDSVRDSDASILKGLFENEGFQVRLDPYGPGFLNMSIYVPTSDLSLMLRKKIKGYKVSPTEAVEDLLDTASDLYIEKNNLNKSRDKFVKAIDTMKNNLLEGKSTEVMVPIDSDSDREYLVKQFEDCNMKVELIADDSIVPYLTVSLPEEVVLEEVSRKLKK